jgi:cyanate lyase
MDRYTREPRFDDQPLRAYDQLTWALSRVLVLARRRDASMELRRYAGLAATSAADLGELLGMLDDEAAEYRRISARRLVEGTVPIDPAS